MTFSVIDWLVAGIYLAVVVAIGIISTRRHDNVAGYFLGGRAMPAWAVACSVLATALSGATFIGVPEMTFGGNLTYLILNIGEVIAGFIVAFLFVPVIYRAGTITIYGYLGKRFGPSSVTAASSMFLIGRLLSSGARLFIAAIAFSLMLYGDTQDQHLIAAIVLFGVVGTLYTVCGGIRAVIWTDTIQLFVMVFAALLSIYLLLRAIPLSAGEVVAVLRDFEGVNKLKVVDFSFNPGRPFTFWTGVFAATVVATSTFGVDHDMAQRVLTARSALHGGWALVASKLMAIPVVLLFMIIGLLLSIFYGRPDIMGDATPADTLTDPQGVYPQFLLNHLPMGLRGLTLAGLIAAALSTFDSAINAMGSVIIADFYIPLVNRGRKRAGLPPREDSVSDVGLSRISVAVMGGALTLFAILAVYMKAQDEGTLIDFALGIMAFAHAPLLGVFCTALFTRRGNPVTVLAGLICGVITVLLVQPYMLQRWLDISIAWPWYWVIASPVAFLVCCAGSTTQNLKGDA